VQTGAGAVIGVARGLDAQGALLVEEDGHVIAIASGTVTAVG